MNRIRLFAAVAALLMILCLCACGEDAPSVSGSDTSGTDVSATDAVTDWYALLDEEERAVADVVLSSTDAFNAKDENAYMATVDPESEALEETLEYIRLIFGKYSLTAEVEEIEVVSVKKDTAELLVTQTTLRTPGEGRAFADVRTLLRHTMVCHGGEWYISATVVESRTELDTDWDIAGDYLSAQQTSGSDAPAAE